MPRRRILRPPNGPQYELWDLAWVVFIVPLFVYVMAQPALGTRQAGSWLTNATSVTNVGYVLGATGLFGIACAYSPRLTRYGLMACWFSPFVWSGALVVGFILRVVSGDFIIADMAGLGSAVFWGYLARQAFHIGATSVASEEPSAGDA